MSQAAPSQPGSHWHWWLSEQLPWPQEGEHTGSSQAVPFHPEGQVQVRFSLHVPRTHSGSQGLSEQSAPENPGLHSQTCCSLQADPFLHSGLHSVMLQYSPAQRSSQRQERSFWQAPWMQGFSHSGTLQDTPCQFFTHMQVRFSAHTPLTQEGEQTGTLHLGPPQPGSQAHMSGAVQLPWTHELFHTGWSQAVPFQPLMHLQVVLSALRLPWTQEGLTVFMPKAEKTAARIGSFEYSA
jgi:hypothetical protein